MKEVQNTFKSIVENPRHIFKLTIQGILVGIFSGLMVCLYRFLLYGSEDVLRSYLAIINSNILYIALFFIFLVILGLLTAFLMRWEKDAMGSGIPQVNAETKGFLDVNWYKTLFAKILGGVFTALGGLSLGPEGPSVQIGAMAGKGVSKIFKESKTDELRLILVGSAVGITAAFNAPLAGVVFILEEINHGFDKTLVFIALVSEIVSDFISKMIFGQSTVLTFQISNIPLSSYWLLILLGLVLGLLGYAYNVGMIKAEDLWAKIPNLSLEVKFVSVFLVSGVIALVMPEISCGGHYMMGLFDVAIPSLTLLLIYFVGKSLFSIFSFSSGAPGGIFLPILVLGAYIGAIFASIFIPLCGLDNALVYKFIIISMAGFFTATVRSPITGIVLLSEMSGSTESLVAMLVVCLIAYIVPTLLGNEPIYEALLDRLLDKRQEKFTPEPSRHVLSEYMVPLDCKYIGVEIQNIPFPKNSIVVSVIRNGSYVIAKEDFKINYGDQIHILTDVNDFPYANREIEEIINGKKH
ncbi:chloride channel protein [Methanobrevibacter sp.]|uniref:ClC family H(+)/Cl(-) exchange transporter n=1 Tax=Methanobrevibacter sp. TaxID=66852 RepID=UPI0038906DF0